MSHWEEKTKRIIEKKQFREKQNQFNQQHQKFLDMRRKKLSDLLQSEEKQYINEIIMNQETPEQVRHKMEQKLIALKTQRETERQELVKKLQEKRFMDSADELRKNEAEAFAVSCYLEQENQMLDKMKKREKEKKEEEAYVKLNQYDNLKKIEKEKLDLIAKKEKERQTYDFLKWQREQQEAALKKANELNEIEKARLKEQWRRDEESEENDKQQKLLMNKQVYRDIEEFNRKEEIERKKKSDYEKIKDKELVNSIVEKEKALDNLDKLEKERKIKEFHQNKKYLEYIMNQKKEAEAWMDKIAQDEADRDYKKKQEQWMKEEAKRIQEEMEKEKK